LRKGLTRRLLRVPPAMDQPNRIDAAFTRLKREGRKGFVAYIAAGDPDLERTFEIALALEGAGVDILELGVPFSDPLADGIVNQLAAARALASGTTLTKLLAAVQQFRQRSQLPVVLFTYLNPVYAFGFERFLGAAEQAGVDGVLFLDLPPDEAVCHEELNRQSSAVKMIRLIAPTTPTERVREIAAAGGGFLYVISREGVTGEQTELAEGLAAQAVAIRAVTKLPLAIGFGISTPEQARAAAAHADAVVVGSAIVRRVGEYGAATDLAQRVADFVRPLVSAVKSV
jgi:tryptophan synthase alpha chain